MEVALKIAGTSFSAMQLTFLRFLIGGLCLLPFAILDLSKRHYELTPGDLLYLFILGFICICISMLLFQLGVMQTNANLAAVIISINPVFTMVFAQAIVQEKFTSKKAFVLILNVVGLLIAANPLTLLQSHVSITGILLTLAAAVSFGLYTALGKKRIDKIGGMAQNSIGFLFGSTAMAVMMLIMGQPVFSGIRMSSLPLLLYLGIFVTGIGYYCYNEAIEISGPSTASITFFIKPIFAPLIALMVLGESITPNLILGILFILAGSLLNFIRSVNVAANLLRLEMSISANLMKSGKHNF